MKLGVAATGVAGAEAGTVVDVVVGAVVVVVVVSQSGAVKVLLSRETWPLRASARPSQGRSRPADHPVRSGLTTARRGPDQAREAAHPRTIPAASEIHGDTR